MTVVATPLLTDFFTRIRYIRSHVLGMNMRNSELIFKQNPLELYQLVDNKILTKQALTAKSIPTPIMYFTVQSYFELKDLANRTKPFSTFVVKPANGFGGEGVLIVNQVHDDGFETAGGGWLTTLKFTDHVQDILSGVYSLNQMPDHVLCEEKLEADPAVAALTYKGIPDIRVVLFRGVPVMAMLRLSTKKSQGKANLHQGGIGAGVNLVTGRTTHAIYSKQYIDHHPDSGQPLIGALIPTWDKVLELASRCFDAAPLGYMGVDIVLDPRRGPMVLELNVRPGLMIQMANRMGLKPILVGLGAEDTDKLSIPEKIAFGKGLYEANAS